ncbi:hypothetical protein NQ318_022832 [Aromia moschata]|uniref:Peptidase S1 domain-containing protein n=1 Tax=Aromia moschata TaxID=1265417 RepID=A0AAV8XVQ2_9CUCU|nr:hypothetical protein NQ318_022832 [Aromia moschata]
MKAAILFLAYLGCAMTLPSGNLEIDWSKIQPMDVFVEPLPGAKPEICTRVAGGSEAPPPNSIPYQVAIIIDGSGLCGGSLISREWVLSAAHCTIGGPPPNSIPYQVAIIIDGSGLCGGSLISREWVLSAAHCTIGASFVQVILGAHNIQTTEATQVVSTSRDITNHPSYSSNTLANDISLIRLPSPVTLTRAIQVIALAPASSGTFAGSNGLLSGWGRTSDAYNSYSATLQRVNLNIITNAVCQNTFGSLVLASTICTSGVGSVGACDSDSGGPLVVFNTQVGVVSFGADPGCIGGQPTAFARVSSFRSWISSVAGV